MALFLAFYLTILVNIVMSPWKTNSDIQEPQWAITHKADMPALRNTQIPHLLLAVLYYYCWKALEKEGKQKGHGFLSLDKESKYESSPSMVSMMPQLLKYYFEGFFLRGLEE